MTVHSVTDEQLGKLAKRLYEVFRRTRKGTYDVDWLLHAVQDLIDRHNEMLDEYILDQVRRQVHSSLPAEEEVYAFMQAINTLVKEGDDHLLRRPESIGDEQRLAEYLKARLFNHWNDDDQKLLSLSVDASRFMLVINGTVCMFAKRLSGKDTPAARQFWIDRDELELTGAAIGAVASSCNIAELATAVGAELVGEPTESTPNREAMIEACRVVLGLEVVDGLLSLELDEEDLFMALYSELENNGVKDPEAFLRAADILE